VFINRLFGNNDAKAGEPPYAHPGRDRAEMMDWMRQGHQELVDRVAALDDEEATKPRLVQVAWTAIEHDLYHAGELSHLRAIQQGNDRWGYFPGRGT
jgi:hypothetical protein